MRQPLYIILVALLLSCAEVTPAPVVAIAPTTGTVHVAFGTRDLLSLSSHVKDRRKCSTVMIIPGEQARLDDERLLALLEARMMDRGLRIISAALTGRVVNEGSVTTGPDNERRFEQAARLPMLERALILAKRANADCVVQLLTFEPGLTTMNTRWFVWSNGAASLSETDEATARAAPAGRSWFASGPAWRVEGKLIDVDTGLVLALISLQYSTPDASAVNATLPFVGGQLNLNGAYPGWILNRDSDVAPVRTAVFSRLAAEIRGDI
jgi:hypothetical protein